jgi:hypothetical protein
MTHHSRGFEGKEKKRKEKKKSLLKCHSFIGCGHNSYSL